MQCKDIPDEVAIQAARDWQKRNNEIQSHDFLSPGRSFHNAGGDVADLIVERTGAPYKVAIAKLERLVRRGKLDYGVSLRTCWPVE